jgi:5-methylcytosine-specific restriction endonuclease McrA
MSASILERPTLVLNKTWTPIRTATTREALGLVANGSARIIDPVTYEVHDLDSWHSASQAQDRFADARIRSMRLSLVPPEVIVLTGYDGLGARVVVFSRWNLFKRDRYRCQYCGARPGTGEMTVDHIVPRSRGGVSSWENCVLACLDCNSRKRNRTPDESGMRLRKAPVQPSWAALSALSQPVRIESWKSFLSRAYWEMELEP